MRWILLAASSLLLAVWIILGSSHNPLGTPLPALGSFFHPTNGFWQSALPGSTRPVTGTIRINHPLARGEVFYDERKVPHIFSTSVEAGFFIQGWLTARDRLWQMDISTRGTGGELAEVLGPTLLDRDRSQIRQGFRAAAELADRTWRDSFPADYALIEAFCAGVNTWIEDLKPSDYPLEFKLLGYAPRRWTPYHTALMLKGMTQSMTNRNTDAAYTKAMDSLGLAGYNDFYPLNYPKQRPIVPRGTTFDFEAATPRRRSPLPVLHDAVASDAGLSATPGNALPPAQPDLPHDYRPANGSNNWAISGDKSLTGRPILAGDPHLNLTLPSIWYEMQLHTPDGSVRGVSLPGLPGVVIGFNRSIAWSMTNGSQDVVDYYRMDWTDSTRTAYRIGNQTHPVRLRPDTLRCRGRDPEVVVTKWTQRGPVPVEDPDSPYDGLAKDATYLYTHTDRPHAEVMTMRLMMETENYADFKAALRGYSEPIMNFAYADKHGDIAILTNGFWPLRRPDSTGLQAGRTVSDGSQARPNWTAYIPFEHLPEQYNPQRGFVMSANQPPTDTRYPYPYYGHFPTYRAPYLARKLETARRLDYQDVQALQNDPHSFLAEELLPLLLARINRRALDREGQHWFRILADWDYDYDKDKTAPAFFERWRQRAYELTTDELTAEAGFPGLPTWRWIELLRRQPDHQLFDIRATERREDAATITRRAFDEIVEELEDKPIESWLYDRNSQLNHLGRVPGLGAGLLLADGHKSTPNALLGSHGPSWRMVVELGEKPHGYGVLPGGVAGNPADPNYEGGVAEWSRGRYFDLHLWNDPETAARKAEGRLIFE